MSIKQGNEIKALHARVEVLEGRMNEAGLTPRTVGGTKEPGVEKKPAKKTKEAKVEGSE